nr:hypothetical protein [Micrococcus flavus]
MLTARDTSVPTAELVRRWESAARPAPTVAEVGSMLAERYRARPLAPEILSGGHLQNDEELRDGTQKVLWTITDPVTLLHCARHAFASLDAYLRHLESGRQEEDEAIQAEDGIERADVAYWTGLESPIPEEDHPYGLVLTQHALGQRVTVILEVEDGAVTGFKVEGVLGRMVDEHLEGLVGFPEPDPTFHEAVPVMRRGDPGDEMFVRHLRQAARFGLI